MVQHKRVTVTGVANIEVKVSALVGTVSIKRVVHGVFILETTATLQKNAIIRIYVDQMMVAEVDCALFLDNSRATTPLVMRAPFIPLEVELAAGQSLYVGHVSGATLSTFAYVTQYEDAEAA